VEQSAFERPMFHIVIYVDLLSSSFLCLRGDFLTGGPGLGWVVRLGLFWGSHAFRNGAAVAEMGGNFVVFWNPLEGKEVSG
jgi:hypothetical protein